MFRIFNQHAYRFKTFAISNLNFVAFFSVRKIWSIEKMSSNPENIVCEKNEYSMCACVCIALRKWRKTYDNFILSLIYLEHLMLRNILICTANLSYYSKRFPFFFSKIFLRAIDLIIVVSVFWIFCLEKMPLKLPITGKKISLKFLTFWK